MKAVVLAGGFGERLRPLTENTPKPLIPVAGRPCIDYVIRSLVSSGFKEIVVTTGYMSDRLIKRVGAGVDYDASILYSFEDQPAGTAGAVRKSPGAGLKILIPGRNSAGETGGLSRENAEVTGLAGSGRRRKDRPECRTAAGPLA